MTNHGAEPLPPRGATIRRDTGRVIPLRRADGRCLLLHGWDPDHTDEPFWFTIGGAVEPGEDLRAAAVRELAEEVGLVASPADLRGPLTTNEIRFDWAGRHIVQQQTFFALDVDDFVVSFDGQDGLEAGTIDEHGWFTYDELAADGATFPEVLEAVWLATATRRPGA
ncbi:NUDIX hydrolase [Flexivirga caeni]|uniref:NUDIX domain-containing protein n=1 Tax=Flexivirga caeni TaxID=2294115 RepID=A0A3M9M7U7_9MICO|nr:NUDIX domain-containing protein [Flexivirga caeni]RNI21546.1 NUDIX domain-containing protein [Flexivirga caeni]